MESGEASVGGAGTAGLDDGEVGLLESRGLGSAELDPAEGGSGLGELGVAGDQGEAA